MLLAMTSQRHDASSEASIGASIGSSIGTSIEETFTMISKNSHLLPTCKKTIFVGKAYPSQTNSERRRFQTWCQYYWN